MGFSSYLSEGYNRLRREQAALPRLNIWQLLLVAFVCFKVLDLIDWSWWAVFIPVYIHVVLNYVAALLFSLAAYLEDHR